MRRLFLIMPLLLLGCGKEEATTTPANTVDSELPDTDLATMAFKIDRLEKAYAKLHLQLSNSKDVEVGKMSPQEAYAAGRAAEIEQSMLRNELARMFPTPSPLDVGVWKDRRKQELLSKVVEGL